MSPTDNDLMTEVRDGRVEKLAVLFERYQTMLYNFFLRLTGNRAASEDLVIQVPASSSVEVRSMMDGMVVVEGVSGEIDINNVNGPVTLKNVSGNTLVHTVSGDIEVSLSRIPSGKPLSFSTMHGDIDVTLPGNVKANLKMKSDQGEIYTDFDVNLTRRPTRSEAPEKTVEGKYRIAFDNSLLGTVNGGGPEISFQTFAGNIYIRKGK